MPSAASHHKSHHFLFRCSIWKGSEEDYNSGFTNIMLVTTLGLSQTKIMLIENSTEYLLWNHRSPVISQVCSQGLHIQMPGESSHIGPAASQIWLLH